MIKHEIQYCVVCGKKINRVPKRSNKYCGPICAAIKKSEYAKTLTLEQAKHWCAK